MRASTKARTEAGHAGTETARAKQVARDQRAPGVGGGRSGRGVPPPKRAEHGGSPSHEASEGGGTEPARFLSLPRAEPPAQSAGELGKENATALGIGSKAMPSHCRTPQGVKVNRQRSAGRRRDAPQSSRPRACALPCTVHPRRCRRAGAGGAEWHGRILQAPRSGFGMGAKRIRPCPKPRPLGAGSCSALCREARGVLPCSARCAKPARSAVRSTPCHLVRG